jgi:hypothetical protein
MVEDTKSVGCFHSWASDMSSFVAIVVLSSDYELLC